MMAGRDPNYAENLRERMLAAATRNQLEASRRNLSIDWLFVEWNPPSDDLLSNDLAPLGFRCYVVSPEVHDSLVDPSVADKYKFMEGFAKNAGSSGLCPPWGIKLPPITAMSHIEYVENNSPIVSSRITPCPGILAPSEREVLFT